MKKHELIEHFNLRSKLRFNMQDGQIWLDENRMALIHTKSLGSLRHELFEALGKKNAQKILLRSSFQSGQLDANVARKLIKEEKDFDVFNIGPALHGFEGIVKAIIKEWDIDWEAGRFSGEVECENCWEAEAHLHHFGATPDASCWTLLGYASGYTSQFFKRFITFRETKCVGRGDDKCVITGKPADEWGGDSFQDYFHQEDMDISLFEMEEELDSLRGHGRIAVKPGKLVGQSTGFLSAFNLLSKACNSMINVLLLGETGVGKEVFAQWLHENSDRADLPFVAINCSAIPYDLIESELFGVEKGAYTGAEKSRPGRFERADGGTLFLDEVGDLSLSAQVKLLRVLQTGEVERLGGETTRKVSVRLIAATNVNLSEAIEQGKFRSDLYYRLATYPVMIPPLRERKSDIPILITSMIEKFSPIYQKTIKDVSERAMEALLNYDFPGNVRELENMVERGVLLVENGCQLEINHLFTNETPVIFSGATVNDEGVVDNLDNSLLNDFYNSILDGHFDLKRHERKLLELAVSKADGNLTHASKLLGLTRRQLAYRFKQFSDEDYT